VVVGEFAEERDGDPHAKGVDDPANDELG
jgi:hypothetical protein